MVQYGRFAHNLIKMRGLRTTLMVQYDTVQSDRLLVDSSPIAKIKIMVQTLRNLACLTASICWTFVVNLLVDRQRLLDFRC